MDGRALDLTGRVAVVTGAAGGIGRATALALAACGARLAICDRDTEGLATLAASVATEVCTGTVDVRDTTAVATFLAATATRFDRVDILVNNAGGGFRAPVLAVSDGGQRALVDENFTSVTNLVRGCVPLMAGGGAIINVTSMEAFRAAPGFGVYAAMKAAVEHLTRTLALELAPSGIRVVCVAPDAIRTQGHEALSDAASAGQVDDYVRKVPLGWGTPEACADVIAFLASDLARFITGSTVHVDGGSLAAGGWSIGPDGDWVP